MNKFSNLINRRSRVGGATIYEHDEHADKIPHIAVRVVLFGVWSVLVFPAR